ncbi:MAG: D-cysteine desulfhydrase, partial [Xanthomonadales bacterium]|nr:D-cysteine desulfhydrase [Xanthomonadales bacterium]
TAKTSQDTGCDLNQLLEAVPRISLAHLPTPLEFLPRLTKHFGGPDIYVKRDDCTGLGTGGNKTRKLEFVMAEAMEQGATTVITNGAVQSNHARQTAAAAAKLGMKCELLFEHRVPQPASDYLHSGNVFLDGLFGARTWNYPKAADMNAEMEKLAGQLKDEGEKPYIIVGGASCPLGALGYVGCAAEIIEQSRQLGIELGRVVHATGSAGTQAGLVVGLKAACSGIPVLGIGVNAPQDIQEERVFKLARETAARLDQGIVIERSDIVANCNYVGDGYGLVTKGMIEAVRLVAELEGLLFDPVYSGKGLAGMFDLMRKGHFDDDAAVVFVHTGGSAALFAYREQMAVSRD